MELIITNHIAQIISNEVVISGPSDALELMATLGYEHGAEAMVLQAHNLPEDFFRLSTGLAGEILQKFSTYSFRMAIVGDFSHFTSRSLADFIRESNRQGRILFVYTTEEALRLLSEKIG